MAQLIVRNLEQALVRSLKKRASEHGVSMDDEIRRILADALLADAPTRRRRFWEMLSAMPDVGEDEFFERDRNIPIIIRGN